MEETEAEIELAEEEIVAPPEEKTLLQIFSELSDESGNIRAFDLSSVNDLLSDCLSASTLKRLSNIPDLDIRIDDSFAIIQDLICSIDDRVKFDKVLISVTSNFEHDVLVSFLRVENDI